MKINSQTIFSNQIPLDQQKISNMKLKWNLDFTIWQGDSSLIGSRFYIFAVALRLRASVQSRAWNRLLQAVPGKRSGKRVEVTVGLFMKNGGRISVTAVGKQSRNKLRIWPRNPRDVHFSVQKAVKVEQAK